MLVLEPADPALVRALDSPVMGPTERHEVLGILAARAPGFHMGHFGDDAPCYDIEVGAAGTGLFLR